MTEKQYRLNKWNTRLLEKQYLVKHCLNCTNMICVSLGWGKQELQDCKGRPISHTHSCDVFMPSKQVKDWLRYNPNCKLISISQAMELKE